MDWTLVVRGAAFAVMAVLFLCAVIALNDTEE